MSRKDSPGDPKPNKIVASYLVATVFLAGAAVMLIEILAARIIAPFFGSSIFIWTAVISVTLLSLALGYFFGGKAADRAKPGKFLYTAVLIAGFYLFLVLVIKKPVLTFSMQLGLRLGALFSSVLLFALPLFLLGTVTPLAVKLYTSSLQRIGSDVGILYFFSTIGSFLGTLLAGFVLLPNFSVTQILLFAANLLVVISLIYFVALRKNIKYALFLFLLICNVPFLSGERLLTKIISGIRWQELYKSDSFYGRLKVIEVNGNSRFLVVDGINQGGVSVPDGLPQVPYAYVVNFLAKMSNPQMKRALVIGLGPGIIPNILSRRGVSVEAVEIDPHIASLYKKYFAEFGKQENIALFIEDGRCFIKRNSHRYDCVVLDVFLGDSSPWHLLTREAFSEIKKTLTEKGALVINFVGLPKDASEAKIVWAIHRTLAEVFPYTSVFNAQRAVEGQAQNVFFLASLSEPAAYFSEVVSIPLSLKSTVEGALGDRIETVEPGDLILTDEYNPVDFYTARTKEAWRRAIMNSSEKDIMLD